MGAVKQWGMDQVDALTTKYFNEGMSWAAAAERADEEVSGPRYDGPDEPDGDN